MKTSLQFLSVVGTTVLFLSGCAGNETQIMQQADFNGVSKPGQVLVGQFAFAANDPNPDQSILNRMKSQYTPAVPQTPEEQAGQAVAQKMQKSLIKDLTKEGIVAQGTLDNIVPPVGTLIIEGELLTVNPAGGFQRLSPGLANGQARVISYVSAYLVTTKGITSFAKFYSNTQTSVDPEVSTTLGVGPAAGAGVGSLGGQTDTLTSRTETAKADAALIAKQIAKKMGKIFAAETWSSPTSPN